ncbi:MAG TPA: PilZ domain-containing protein [bacterium]|nr:PilZ domain-containing protein [bacterium]
MATDDIEKLYEQVIEEGRERGELDGSKPGSERRNTPRLRADATELTVRAQLQVSAIDVSVGGVAFHSNFPVQLGQPLNITVGNLFTVDAVVVSCRLEEADEDFSHTLYRVQCKFPEEEQGKYLLVMVKELDRRKTEGPKRKK